MPLEPSIPPDPNPNPQPAPTKPKRRPRYRGTHPRQFHERYKELNPEAYPDEIAKINASGKTPAGMHRPVLLDEVLAALGPAPGQHAIDATLGYGGHTTELLQRLLPGGHLYATDRDPLEIAKTETRLRRLGFGEDCLTIRRMNFAGLPQLMTSLNVPGVDLILADLGVSSMQLDDPNRGFSYKKSAPLDLRMNPSHGEPASTWLAKTTAEELALVLRENADEPKAHDIAEACIRSRTSHPILTTQDLAEIVRSIYGDRPNRAAEEALKSALARVFQALRIQVNDEFGSLNALLRALPTLLLPGGRAAIISFHSGEDRRVKKSFEAGLHSGSFSAISDTVIRPSPEELHTNPRSSPARLRWAIKT